MTHETCLELNEKNRVTYQQLRAKEEDGKQDGAAVNEATPKKRKRGGEQPQEEESQQVEEDEIEAQMRKRLSALQVVTQVRQSYEMSTYVRDIDQQQ